MRNRASPQSTTAIVTTPKSKSLWRAGGVELALLSPGNVKRPRLFLSCGRATLDVTLNLRGQQGSAPRPEGGFRVTDWPSFSATALAVVTAAFRRRSFGGEECAAPTALSQTGWATYARQQQHR